MPFWEAATLENRYKPLLDYGDYVLAGHDRGTHGFEFVTWMKNPGLTA